jgi:uncharacterized protein (DUF2236 family)
MSMLAPELTFGTPDTISNDQGYFGPETITWRIHSDVMAVVGGVRALFLQALEPRAFGGVQAHSRYREEPFGRLLRTAEYIGVISFGTKEEADRAASKVRAMHKALGLDVPELLLWVHNGFTDSLLDIAMRSGMNFSKADQDRYVKEQLIAAELIGLDPAICPSNVDELNAYYENKRHELVADKAVRESARFIFLPPMSKFFRYLTPSQIMWAIVVSLSFASLPRWVRKMYGDSWRGSTLAGPRFADASTNLTLKILRRILLKLPNKAKKGPHVQAAEIRLKRKINLVF